MPSPDPPDADVPPPVRWVGRCPRCGRTVEADSADLAQSMERGWPRCCGADMAFGLVREAPESTA
jgi:hypothetical protein